MDQPNGGEDSPQRMTRAEYSRSVRAAMEERRQRAMINRQQYQPQIHEQIQRLFSEYEAPFYARARGFGRKQTLALAESTVLGLAAGTDRRLSDTETQALTEHFLSSVHNMLAWKWIMTGLAAYMTYRGRQTMRFPFFKPVIAGGRFDPAIGGPQVRIMWHTARFAAYYGAFWLIGEPITQGVNFMRQSYALDQDTRLSSLLRDAKKKQQASQEPFATQDSNQQRYGEAWKLEAQSEYSSQQTESYREPPTESDQSPRQQTWSTSVRPARQQPPGDNWDITDGLDDASPVAPSSQVQPRSTTSYTGSAWDRIRQQSQYSSQSNQSQRMPEWGNDDDASAQYRGFKNPAADSAMDEERAAATAKSRAQREFDELLEKERAGGDQRRNSWGRR